MTRALWIGTITGIIGSIVMIIVLTFGELPDFEELENPEYDLASIVYDTNGKEFGKYYIENRQFVEYDELSPLLVNTLYSVEDERYYQHTGIDFKALARVMFKTIIFSQDDAGGGSTITQQLAKLLFSRESLANKSKLQRIVGLAKIKFKEWITAVRLERRYTKEEIVAMYLNKFEFINGAHGIQSAAEIYFGKDQFELSEPEAATLIGMLQNPSLYNPLRFPNRAKERRNVVLSRMEKHDIIDRVARDSLIASPIDMSQFKRSTQSDGIAPYFRSELTKWLKNLLLRKEYFSPDGNPYDIYRDGLKIYTTIDINYQIRAEKALWDHLQNLQERYWKVWRYKDPITFEADEDQEKLRRESIDRRVRDTDLYKILYQSFMQEIITMARQEFDIDIKEPTIRRLMQDNNYLNELPQTVKDAYTKVIKSNKTRNQWSAFQNKLKEKLQETTTAKVFAYNNSGYEMKEMTRLDSVIYHIRHLQGGMLSVDPRNGAIKAWVGGADHHYFKYDHVTMRRQVGSTIKPFVYATALAVHGISPCQEYQDIQYTIAPGDAGFKVDAEWSPSNANGLFTGNSYNLYQGLLYSKNSITVRIVKEMGTVELIRDLLHHVGMDKEERLSTGRFVIPEVPSICLGSVDLSLLNIVGGYTTFANDGIYSKPYFIDRIEDKNGKTIYQNSTLHRRAINSLYNSVMVDMLQNNTGGGFGLGLKSPNGGKTGTTNDYADGWFIGITPSLVSGIWVGGDEKWVRFYTLDDGQGFVMARPIFQNYMKALETVADSIGYDVGARFKKPPVDFKELVDCSRYKQKEPEEEQEQTKQEKIDLNEFDQEFDDFDDFDDFDNEIEDTPRDSIR